MKWVEIICAEEDAIDWEVLDWADARDLWDDNEDVTGKYSVIRDVLPNCPSAEIIEKEYDYDLPGRSGVEYIIETNDPDLLKAEIVKAISDLIRPNDIHSDKLVLQTTSLDKNKIVNFLMMQAFASRRIRAPAGYQGMAEATANILEVAAKDLQENNYEKDTAIEILTTVVSKIHIESVKNDIEKIIGELKSNIK